MTMEIVTSKLRNGKLLQEFGKALSGKDASKRLAESLPDIGGKKRILGDITNKAVATRAKSDKNNISKNELKENSSSLKSVSSVDKVKPAVINETLHENAKHSTSMDESTMYVTALEEMHDSAIDISNIKEEVEEVVQNALQPELPPGVEDFDSTCLEDLYSVSNFATNIFKYYKEREKLFPIKMYLAKQPEMTKSMRAILVDWMVEVQESFELNHETLYLAVKLVDRYLMHHFVPKARLQLLGATAAFVASKFDERLPPLVDDFLYICDDSYTRADLLTTERTILRTVDFDLGIPLSYRFLRRYARCSRISMELLTLARFILETALMDYDLIEVLDSKIAAAALLLALKMKESGWNVNLEYHSGYGEEQLQDIMYQLNRNISGPQKSKHLQTIRTKYSHPIFFEVAKVPALKLPNPSK